METLLRANRMGNGNLNAIENNKKTNPGQFLWRYICNLDKQEAHSRCENGYFSEARSTDSLICSNAPRTSSISTDTLLPSIDYRNTLRHAEKELPLFVLLSSGRSRAGI